MPGHNVKRLGAEVIADMLAGYGVSHVFMVPAVLRRTFVEMERRTSIARIHCHGEKAAAYMGAMAAATSRSAASTVSMAVTPPIARANCGPIHR